MLELRFAAMLPPTLISGDGGIVLGHSTYVEVDLQLVTPGFIRFESFGTLKRVYNGGWWAFTWTGSNLGRGPRLTMAAWDFMRFDGEQVVFQPYIECDSFYYSIPTGTEWLLQIW